MEAVKTILSTQFQTNFAKQKGNQLRAFYKKHRISTATVSNGKILMVQPQGHVQLNKPFSHLKGPIQYHEPFDSIVDWIEYLQESQKCTVEELILEGTWNGIAKNTLRVYLTGPRMGEIVPIKQQKEMIDLHQGAPSTFLPSRPTELRPIRELSWPTTAAPPPPPPPPPATPLEKKDKALSILRRAVTAAPFVPQFPPLGSLPLEKIREMVIEPPLPAPRSEPPRSEAPSSEAPSSEPPRIVAPRKKPIMNPEEEDWDEDEYEEDAQPTPTPSEQLAIEVKVDEREKKIQKFMDIIQRGLRELLSETA